MNYEATVIEAEKIGLTYSSLSSYTPSVSSPNDVSDVSLWEASQSGDLDVFLGFRLSRLVLHVPKSCLGLGYEQNIHSLLNNVLNKIC